jgi:hypothetical protein
VAVRYLQELPNINAARAARGQTANAPGEAGDEVTLDELREIAERVA